MRLWTRSYGETLILAWTLAQLLSLCQGRLPKFILSVFQVSVCVDGKEVLKEPLPDLRAMWEDTSFQLERLQANELCVKQEEAGLSKRTQPYFKLSFNPSETPGISQLGKPGADWDSHQ